MSHGTFCFMSFDGYGWWLSSTAAFLYLSWIVHNLVAWFKIRPFLTVRASRIFIGTLCLTVPPTVLQIVNNFLFFNNIADLYVRVRPFEVLMRFVNHPAPLHAHSNQSSEMHGGCTPAFYFSMSSRHATHYHCGKSSLVTPASPSCCWQCCCPSSLPLLTSWRA